jgi:hypothetical protein
VQIRGEVLQIRRPMRCFFRPNRPLTDFFRSRHGATPMGGRENSAGIRHGLWVL